VGAQKAKIAFLTFTRKDESISKLFFELAQDVKIRSMGHRFIALVDKAEEIEPTRIIEQFEHPGQTKYAKIKAIAQQIDADYLLIIDNDVFGSPDQIRSFLQQAQSSGCDIYYGCVEAKTPSSFLEEMYQVDKILSHRLLRPASWKLGFGISIPGQLLFINRQLLNINPIECDTYLDDLLLGLSARLHFRRVGSTRMVVGYEMAKKNPRSFFWQRVRWGRGFASILMSYSSNMKAVFFLLMHGMLYHGIGPILLFVLGSMAMRSIFIGSMGLGYQGILLLLISLFVICSRKVRLGLAYLLLIFPFHLVWLGSVNYYLVRSLCGHQSQQREC